MLFYEKYPELKGKDYVYLNPHGVYYDKELKGVPVDEDKFNQIRKDLPRHLLLYFATLMDTGTENLAVSIPEQTYAGVS